MKNCFAPPAPYRYGATPEPLACEPLKGELDWRLGLWRSAKGKSHEPQAIRYLLALIRPYYPADHQRLRHWESRLKALEVAVHV